MAVTTQVIVVAQHDTSGEMTIITADSGSRKESGWHKNNKREAYKKAKKKTNKKAPTLTGTDKFHLKASDLHMLLLQLFQ